MNKILTGAVLALALFIPAFSFVHATPSDDEFETEETECIDLQKNMRYVNRTSYSTDENTKNRINPDGEVSLLQDFLIDEGYLSVSSDGIFNIRTRAAVRAFQSKMGLNMAGTPGYGKVWSKTRAKIKEMTCGGETTTTPTTSVGQTTITTDVRPITKPSTVSGCKVGALFDIATGQKCVTRTQPLIANEHILGNKDAEIRVIEYSDLVSPFGKIFHTTMNRIQAEYGDKVAWVYRHFPLPLSVYANAKKAAEASECAAELGGNDVFWRYIDVVYSGTSSNSGVSTALLQSAATEVGLNRQAFDTCLASGRYTSLVEEQIQEGTNAGVRGIPTSFVVTKDGRRGTIDGAQPYESVKATIDSFITIAQPVIVSVSPSSAAPGDSVQIAMSGVISPRYNYFVAFSNATYIDSSAKFIPITPAKEGRIGFTFTTPDESVIKAGTYNLIVGIYGVEGNYPSIYRPFTITTQVATSTAPYISSLTSDANGNVTINGTRIDIAGNITMFDGYTQVPTKIVFSPTLNYNLAAGQHYLQIINAQAGNSNIVYFTVTAPTNTSTPTIKVLSPNGGENITTGVPTIVSWRSSNIGFGASVGIELYKNGVYQEQIAFNQPVNGSYTWTPSSKIISGLDYKIRVLQAYEPNVTHDDSDSFFTITAPVVTWTSATPIIITSPKFGDNWEIGKTYSVQWNVTSALMGRYVYLVKNYVKGAPASSGYLYTLGSQLDYTVPQTTPTGVYSLVVCGAYCEGIASDPVQINIVNP